MESELEMELLASTLRQRLITKGMEVTVIPAYLRNVANILATESSVSLRELNSRLRLLGWDNVEMDEYTLELVWAVFDPDLNLHTSPPVQYNPR